jgi:plastocyanin
VTTYRLTWLSLAYISYKLSLITTKNKNKRKMQYARESKISKKWLVIVIGVLGVIVTLGVTFGIRYLVPVNGDSPVLLPAENIFIKASHSMTNGYEYLGQASGAVKGMRNTGGGGPHVDPKYVFNLGSLQAMHVINEDYETHSKHNFNIDEFSVHTRDLGYFETQTITFLADEKGTFEYYCSIHPEMKGTIEIV